MNRDVQVLCSPGLNRVATQIVVGIGILVGAGNASAQETAGIASPARSLVDPAVQDLHARASMDQVRPEMRRIPRGLDAGILVKGWWTIDVRNPDGTLESHTSFENALVVNQPTGTGPFGGSSGDFAISSLLTSNFAFITSGDGSTTVQLNQPLANLAAAFRAAPFAMGSAPSKVDIFVPYLFIAENTQATPNATISFGPRFNGYQFPLVSTGTICGNGGPCTDETIMTIAGNSISLKKSSTATQSGVIASVGTFVGLNDVMLNISPNAQAIVQAYGAPYANVSVLSLNGYAAEITVVQAVAAFTSLTLPAPGTASCGGTLLPPCQIPVAAGQLVSMNVTFSFD